MTMLSFRVDDDLATAAKDLAEHLGIDRSELLRDALRRQVDRLRARAEAAEWVDGPEDDTLALAALADWGPAEDWSDWSDAAR